MNDNKKSINFFICIIFLQLIYIVFLINQQHILYVEYNELISFRDKAIEIIGEEQLCLAEMKDQHVIESMISYKININVLVDNVIESNIWIPVVEDYYYSIYKDDILYSSNKVKIIIVNKNIWINDTVYKIS